MVLFCALQSLSMLLNGTPFAFVIDLAALASRREYLKLDKWLTDKIREHGVSELSVWSNVWGLFIYLYEAFEEFLSLQS